LRLMCLQMTSTKPIGRENDRVGRSHMPGVDRFMSFRALLPCLALCGCGSGQRSPSEAPREPAPAADVAETPTTMPWRQVCVAAASRAGRCGEYWRSGSLETCVEEEPCLSNVMRLEARPGLHESVQEAPCAPEERIITVCLLQVGRSPTVPAANKRLVEDCIARLEPCGRQDRCAPFSMLSDAVQKAMIGCLSLECVSADRCMEHVFDDFGCP
jgi:hypothetical protein